MHPAMPDGESNDETRFSEAMAALQAGRIEETIRRFKELLRSGSRYDRARVFEGRLRNCEEGLAIGIERQPKNFDIRTQRGIARLGRALVLTLGGLDAAETCKAALDDFTAAANLRPDQSAAHLNRANLLLFCARLARASERDGQDLFRMALEELNEACRLDSAGAAAFHARGAAYFYLAREVVRNGGDADRVYAKAIDDFSAAERAEPEDAFTLKDLGVAKVALAKYRIARKLKAKELFEEARDHLSAAIERDPDLYGAWFERGHALFALKLFEDAARDWERAAELDPDRADQLAPLLQEARERAAQRKNL